MVESNNSLVKNRATSNNTILEAIVNTQTINYNANAFTKGNDDKRNKIGFFTGTHASNTIKLNLGDVNLFFPKEYKSLVEKIMRSYEIRAKLGTDYGVWFSSIKFIKNLIEEIGSKYTTKIVDPDISICEDNTIDFDWDNGEYSLLINVEDSEGNYEYFGDRVGVKNKEIKAEELEPGEIDGVMAFWLAEHFAK